MGLKNWHKFATMMSSPNSVNVIMINWLGLVCPIFKVGVLYRPLCLKLHFLTLGKNITHTLSLEDHHS